MVIVVISCYHFWISLPPCNQIHHYPLQLFWNVMTCTHSNCNTDFVIWKKYHSDILIFNIFSAVIIKFNRNFDIIISVLDPPPSCHHLSKFFTTTPINYYIVLYLTLIIFTKFIHNSGIITNKAESNAERTSSWVETHRGNVADTNEEVSWVKQSS